MILFFALHSKHIEAEVNQHTTPCWSALLHLFLLQSQFLRIGGTLILQLMKPDHFLIMQQLRCWSSEFANLSILAMHTHAHTRTHTHTQREREKGREGKREKFLPTHTNTYTNKHKTHTRHTKAHTWSILLP